MLALSAALHSETARGDGGDGDGSGGIPCAEYEWVEATWHPPQAAECHRCYDCLVGQVCRRRGGCENCTAGEYDDDGDPTQRCVPCPAGETSLPGATTRDDCHDIEKLLCGSGLTAVVLGVSTWACGGCQTSRCQELGKKCSCVDDDKVSVHVDVTVQRDDRRTKGDYVELDGADGLTEQVSRSAQRSRSTQSAQRSVALLSMRRC